jgi:hypothetical protein
MKRLLIDRGGALVLAVFVVYALIAPAHITYGDNAELAGLGAVGGVGHPPGYPLYVLWLRLWSWLPLEAAHTAALATALLAALSVFVLHAASRAWGARPIAATLAVGLYAVSPIALRIHSEAEVFALNGLLVALVLWLAAREAPLRGGARVLALALVAGLGIANHLTCVLLLPIGVRGVVVGLRETTRRAQVAAGGVVALCLGLLPYAYLLVAPPTAMSWGSIDNGSALLHHFLRTDYGGPWGLSGHHADVGASTNLLVLAASIARAYFWVLPLLGLGGLVVFAARGDRQETRVAWLLLAISLVLAGPLLIARFNINPIGLERYVVERFHLLPLLLLTIPIAVTLDRIVVGRVPSRLRAVVVAGALVTATALSLPSVARAHSPELEQGLDNILQSLPRDSVVLVSTDSEHFGLAYLQSVRGVRSDVLVITTPQLGRPAYRARLREATGFVVDPAAANPLLALVDQILASRRPLFIDPLHASVARAYASYPFGIVFRVVPPGEVPPSVEQVLAINKQVFERYQLGYATPELGELHPYYARTWRLLAEALGAAGRREDQAFALTMAKALSERDE